MDDKNENGKKTKPAGKSFLSVGPTLHYSHDNVQRCWLLAFLVFAVGCLFWSKITTGQFIVFNFENLTNIKNWHLNSSATANISIFQYPWQIPVLGILMGIITIIPILISQLMSFNHSLLFVIAIFFLANLPLLAVFVFVSSLAAACRPLRFRSRFTAIVLCTAPELLYWGYFGGARGAEPLVFGLSFAPWICAWVAGLATAGIVLGIGHYTRYRPSLVWLVTTAMLIIAIFTFDRRIGFGELDYRLLVVKNNPDSIDEFHSHSITESLDETVNNVHVRKYLTEAYFYPADPIAMRAEVKKTIQNQLRHDRWPSWFIVPEELKYQQKQSLLFSQYNEFINRRPQSPRMPIALYYKAILSEYKPDIEVLTQQEVLSFYSDYANEKALVVWYKLYTEYDKAPESLEASWRIAKHWAGQGRFEQAEKLLEQTGQKVNEQLKIIEGQPTKAESFLSPFQPLAKTAMTQFRLVDLQRRINELQNLISRQNRGDSDQTTIRLANFVTLSPHDVDYGYQLEKLKKTCSENDPLMDNILLAQIMLIADQHLRSEKLNELHKKYSETDGGMQALYELARLKMEMWRQQSDENLALKKQYLSEARALLTTYISLYPGSSCAEQAKKHLDNLPAAE